MSVRRCLGTNLVKARGGRRSRQRFGSEGWGSTFRVLKELPVDLFLGAHGGYYGMEAKHVRLGKGDTHPFIDPAGYLRYVEDREAAFLAEWEKQKKAK